MERLKSSFLRGMVILLVAGLGLLMCAAPASEAAASTKAHMAKSSASMVIGKSKSIKVKGAAKDSRITFKSKKKAVAKVSKKGKVTAMRAGNAKIAVTVQSPDGTQTLTYKVKVKKPKVAKKNINVKVGKSKTIRIVNKPAKASKAKYTWKSSNPSVARVKKGKVVGVQPGDATVKIKVHSGKRFSYAMRANVHVAGPEAAAYYTVTFESNGGSAVAPQTVLAGARATQPDDPTRNGYLFEGWCGDQALSQSYDFSTPVSSDLALYAKWLDERFETGVGEISFKQPSAQNIVEDGDSPGLYYVNNQVLLTTVETADRESIASVASGVGGELVGFIDITDDCQVEFPSTYPKEELEKKAEELAKSPIVESATIHVVQEIETDAIPNDAQWSSEEWSAEYPEGKNWGVEAIDAMGAWDHLNEMTEVRVGVIDSMFDTGHEDLTFKRVWNNPTSVMTSDSEKYGDCSHGTHVSGTFAAAYNNGKGVAGVAPRVSLYGYSMLGNDTGAVETDPNKGFVGAMQWKYALAKLITSNCRVINVSMGIHIGGDEGLPFASALTYSVNSGKEIGAFLQKLINKGYDFVIVQSAGNSSVNAVANGIFCGIVNAPDVVDRIIVVGAVGDSGSHRNGLFGWLGDRVFDGYYYADFSNYGPRVDVVAPGVKVFSSVPGSKYEDGHSFFWSSMSWNGTSMAAPHVSGVSALCFSVNPALTGKQVKKLVVDSASVTVTDNESGHVSGSYPLVNASNAVSAALSTHGDAVAPVNPANGMVMGHVYSDGADDEDEPVKDVAVSAYRVSTYQGNLGGHASSTKTDSEGNFELVLEAGRYCLDFYREGYSPFAIADVIVDNDAVTYLDSVPLASASDSGVSTIGGLVKDALDGDYLAGATIKLRPGWDNKTGALASLPSGGEATCTVGEDGRYSISLKKGGYTAECSENGYVTGYTNVVCASGRTDQDIVLTPVLGEGEYRIVLTWSETPRDLDSHIVGRSANSDSYHVFYRNMNAWGGEDDDVNLASLDLDDTTSYGPETITLHNAGRGKYAYLVHDYTNRSESYSSKLSMSGAKVTVYSDAGVRTFNVPINTGGTVWSVFELEDGVVKPVNTMSYESEPDRVGSGFLAGSSLRAAATSTAAVVM